MPDYKAALHTEASAPMAVAAIVPSSAVSNVDDTPQGHPICATFGRQSDLDRHAKKYQPGALMQCQFTVCKYVTYRKDKMMKHVRRPHPTAGVVQGQRWSAISTQKAIETRN